MKIKNVTKNPNGTYEMEVSATGGEMDFLVAAAVNMLIISGAIALKEGPDGNPEPEQEVTITMPENTTIQ